MQKNKFSKKHVDKQKDNKVSTVKRSIATICIFSALGAIALVATSCKKDVENSSQPVQTSYYVTTLPTTTTPATTTEPPEPILTPFPEVAARLEINPDSAGWIKIPGVVDEEIVHRPGDEETGNLFYVDHNLNGKKHEGGAVFADFRNVLSGRKTSDNIILYGHNQKDNSRFGQLDLYKWNYDYYKTNPVINFSTNYEDRQYKIFSVFVTNTIESHGEVFDYHNYIELSDKSRYDEFIEQALKRSFIMTTVDTKPGDKFITLSTCSTEFDGSRLVVLGRQVREGESAEVDFSGYKKNPNPMWPDIYYKYNGGSYVE